MGNACKPPRRLMSLACVVAIALFAVPAVASAQRASSAARSALHLTDERLSLMKQVMASKWISRSPIQDRAQERTVIEGALALARAHGLADAGVRTFFEQQIIAAKEVQLGWGEHWLWSGFPSTIKPPNLTALRAQLTAITPKLVDALANLGRLRCERGVAARLTRQSGRLIRVRYVTDRRRAAIVAALLSVRHRAEPCR